METTNIWLTMLISFLTACIPILFEHVLTKRWERIHQIPRLCVIHIKNEAELQANQARIQSFNKVIHFYYEQNSEVGAATSVQRSLKFRQIVYSDLVSLLSSSEIVVMGLAHFASIEIALQRVVDNTGAFYDFDRQIVPALLGGVDQYCLVCLSDDKPAELSGTFDDNALTYHVLHSLHETVRPQLKTSRIHGKKHLL